MTGAKTLVNDQKNFTTLFVVSIEEDKFKQQACKPALTSILSTNSIVPIWQEAGYKDVAHPVFVIYQPFFDSQL